MDVHEKLHEIVMDDFTVYCADVTELEAEAVLPYLSHSRREKVMQLKNEKARKCSAAAGLLLNYAAARQGWSAALPVEYEIGAHGKPVLDGYYFSLSHSGRIAVCAAAEREIGIDVQKIKPCNAGIIKKYFTAAERALIGGDAEFTRLWSRKEAAVKADGHGLSGILSGVDTSGGTAVVNGKEYKLVDIQTILPGYKMAAAISL